MHARHSRALRGTASAAVATWIAAVSHTLGGGVFPAPALLLVVTALAAPLAVALAGRRLGLGRLALTVVGTQVLLHVAFAATAGLDPAAPSRHVHSGPLPLGGGFASVIPDPGMAVAHVFAAVLTIAVLHRGEQALRAIARGVRRVLGRPTVQTSNPFVTRPVRLPARAVAVPRPLRFTTVVSRRGPPTFVTAAR